MNDIYKYTEECNPIEKHKILIAFDDMIAHLLNNKKLNLVVTREVLEKKTRKNQYKAEILNIGWEKCHILQKKNSHCKDIFNSPIWTKSIITASGCGGKIRNFRAAKFCIPFDPKFSPGHFSRKNHITKINR